VTPSEVLVRNYRAALVGAVSRRSEANLNRGYELGREAVAQGVSVLELARVHHECLLELVADSAATDVQEVAVAASEFFLEVLATVDMAQRAYYEGRAAASAGPAGDRVRDAGQAPRAGRRRTPPAVSPA
jgi:hypothetical protein